MSKTKACLPAAAPEAPSWAMDPMAGVRIWADLSMDAFKMTAELGAAQLDCWRKLMGLAGDAGQAWRWLPNPEVAIQTELLMAEAQAERTADALRETLADMAAAKPGPAAGSLPD